MHIKENEAKIIDNKVQELFNKWNYAFGTWTLFQKCMTVRKSLQTILEILVKWRNKPVINCKIYSLTKCNWQIGTSMKIKLK